LDKMLKITSILKLTKNYRPSDISLLKDKDAQRQYINAISRIYAHVRCSGVEKLGLTSKSGKCWGRIVSVVSNTEAIIRTNVKRHTR
jgi:hypothetical protein